MLRRRACSCVDARELPPDFDPLAVIFWTVACIHRVPLSRSQVERLIVAAPPPRRRNRSSSH